jgi:hypothetical protein
MQPTVPAPPPNPLFGILSWGFVFLVIYVFAKIATEGENRYTICNRIVVLGIVGIVLISLLESINYWRWTLLTPSDDVNPLLIWPVLFMIGFIFIIIPVLDLAMQRYQLRK